MQHGHPLVVALAALTLVAGCAGASYQQQYQAAPAASTRPTGIVVYPFAVDANDVTLNQSIVQRVYRAAASNETEQQDQLAHSVASDICNAVAANLMNQGYSAVCQPRGVPISGENVLVVDGAFTDINEGNRLRRLV
ncbi:MAG TPA: DUF4410 domain-containing protein, partial [Candidatus Binataceae bacterium]|nr:DUF4410 domain-containing protein [Candidatus Binataceae bacterium]